MPFKLLRYLFFAASNPIEARFNVMSKYHYFVYFILFLCKVPVIWHVLNLMILNPRITYTCGGAAGGGGGGGGDPSGGGSDASLLRAATPVCPCDNPTWDRSEFTETVQAKFGLICGKNYLISFSETITYFGMLVGALLFGILSDKFGRILIFCATFLLTGLFGLAISQTPNVPAFFVFRFGEGLGTGGAIVTGFVAVIEYTGIKYRETMTALYHLPINIGHLLIAAVSYAVPDAFKFQIAISVPIFVILLAFYFIYESPLWLVNNNHKERAIKALEGIAKFNKTTDTSARSDIEYYCYSRRGIQEQKLQLTHILKYKKLTRNLGCMAYIYLVCGMGYYGVSQYISHMSGKIHVNIALSAILTIPATCLSVVLLNRMGRKPILLISCMGSGVFMIITALIPEDFKPSFLRVLFASVANGFFFLAFIVVFLYGVELFPTQIRNSALGFLSLLSRVGMMLAPQVNTLSPTIAGCVFGVLALGGGLLSTCLPETKNRELPTTLEEAESRK